MGVVNDVEFCPIFVPYVREASVRFTKNLFLLCLEQFDVKLNPLYYTNKLGYIFSTKISNAFASMFKCCLQIYLFA